MYQFYRTSPSARFQCYTDPSPWPVVGIFRFGITFYPEGMFGRELGRLSRHLR